MSAPRLTAAQLRALRMHAAYMINRVFKTGEGRELWLSYRAAIDELLALRAAHEETPDATP